MTTGEDRSGRQPPATGSANPPEPPVVDDKGGGADLRSAARDARRSLAAPARWVAEQSIASLLVGLDELAQRAAVIDVGWYLASDGEVDLTPAVETMRGRGHRLWLPVVGPDTSIRFRRWEPHTELQDNRYGIPEPVASPGDPTAERTAQELDAVVVPSVALDRAGHRVGFGAGYYDRALAGTTATTIGVGFAVQLVEELTPQPWDVTLDVVVSDEGVVRPTST